LQLFLSVRISALRMSAAATFLRSLTANKPRLLISYYSFGGHVRQIAEAEYRGASSSGADVKLTQFPETLSDSLLKQLKAPPKADHPNVTLDDLRWADGFIFGFPTRYGSPAAQFKSFWDGTGGLWAKGELIGKPFGVFFSTASQNGGQETTAFTSLTNFVHHGMIFVPQGYASPIQFDLTEIHGGGPFGAGTIAGGDGKRQPTKNELELAEMQGRNFAATLNKFKLGKEVSKEIEKLSAKL